MNEDIKITKEEQPLMVTIRCITYNHEPYIRQCLEGFVMQKTNFRFEAIVHDDASTDGTAAIIREYAEKYPDIIKPIYQTENQYSKHDGSLRRIMDEHTHGKYVAPCEGDDYWIDPLKLQKQVDFLEENPEYGMVHTDVKCLHQNTGALINNYLKKNKLKIQYTFEDFLIHAWFLAPCTWLYRRELMIVPERRFVVGDLPQLLEISSQSKVHFLDIESAVYRVLNNSSSHHSSFDAAKKFSEDIFEIQKYYMRKNGVLDLESSLYYFHYIILLKLALKYFQLHCAAFYFAKIVFLRLKKEICIG